MGQSPFPAVDPMEATQSDWGPAPQHDSLPAGYTDVPTWNHHSTWNYSKVCSKDLLAKLLYKLLYLSVSQSVTIWGKCDFYGILKNNVFIVLRTAFRGLKPVLLALGGFDK